MREVIFTGSTNCGNLQITENTVENYNNLLGMADSKQSGHKLQK